LENIERQKTEIEVLKLENFRLTDRIENNQIIDGALAVLVGVLLAVFGPRLIPQRRKNDDWR
jgi:SH3 domain protein